MLAPANSHETFTLPQLGATALGVGVEVTLAGLLLFAPLAFGATEAWSQEYVLGAIAALATMSVLHQFLVRGSRPRLDATTAIILAFIALILLQITHLPIHWIAKFSPQTLQVQSALSQPLGLASKNDATLSFYPLATAAWLRLIVGVATLFVVIRQEYRDLPRIKRLLTTMTVAGVFVALLAAYQNLSRTKLVYGSVPMQHLNSGPFMNYSHFSQFMNLSIAAAVSLLLIWSTELKSRFSLRSDVIHHLRQPANVHLWLAMFLCLIGPVVVMLSMSRMGMLSMFIAGAATLSLISWRTRRSGRGSWITIGILIVLIITLLTSYDAIATRLSTLQNRDFAAGGRLQILKDLLPMYRQFPLVGTGLGTHEYLFPMFSHLLVPQVVAHAENEFAEMLEECGIVGLLLIVAYIGIIFRAYFKAIRRPSSPLQMAAFGLGFGWLAILLHSFTDFGQHLPAVAMLTATVSALLLNISVGDQDRKSEQPVSWPLRLGFVVAALAAIGFIFGPTLVAADRTRRADQQASIAQDLSDQLEATGWEGSDQDFRAMLTAAGNAAALRPADVKIAYQLNAARWHTLARSFDRETGMIQLPAEAAAFVPQIKDAFVATAALCPSYGPPLAMIGKLRVFFLHDFNGVNDIKAAYRLAPHDRSICELAAMLSAQQGNWAESLELFRKSIVLFGSPRNAMDYYLSLRAPQMAFELADGNRERLLYLMERSKNDSSLQRLTARCQHDADQLLEQQVHANDPPADALAEYARTLQDAGQHEQASLWYRKALDRDYAQVAWRLGLAQSLADSGQRDAAIRELRICKNLSSDSAQIASAISQIKLRGGEVAERSEKAVEPTAR